MNSFYTFAFTVILSLLFFSPAKASPHSEVIKGPLPGTVLRVVDGDTVKVKVHLWIGQEVETSVRLLGIDAPELRGKCGRERSMAEASRREMLRLLNNNTVQISNVRLDKYGGRVLAQIRNADGIDVSQHMLAKGFARPYHGEKRKPWCSKTD